MKKCIEFIHHIIMLKNIKYNQNRNDMETIYIYVGVSLISLPTNDKMILIFLLFLYFIYFILLL